MIIYKAMYNPCIHESAYWVISLHKTKEGAEKAIEEHKNNKREQFEQMVAQDPIGWKDIEFGEHKDWMVSEDELLD